MRRVELKMGSSHPSDEPKTCLSFRYQQVPVGLESIHRSTELGLEVLAQIAHELRSKNYEVSEPSEGRKSFGIIGMKCRIGSEALGISAWPPDGGDEWQIRTMLLPPRELTQSELAAWDDVRNVVADVVAKREGVRNLRWLSH